MNTETAPILRKILKDNGRDKDTEITRYKGKYHLLHICANGVPVPLCISKNLSDIRDHIDNYILEV